MLDIATDRLFSIAEACEALRITEPSFKKLRAHHPKIFQPIKVGGRTLFAASQINRYLLLANPHLEGDSEALADAAKAASKKGSN